MIAPKPDEKILKAFGVKKSPHGKGLFYVTSLRVFFETREHGTVFDLPYHILRSYKDTHGNHFRIEWFDGGRWFYELKIHESAKEVFDTYALANKEFASSQPNQ